MSLRLALTSALVAASLASLGSCPAEPATDGGTGVVVAREHHEARNSDLTYWQITIRRDVGGRRESGRVSEKIGRRCSVGERWPGCKTG